MSKAAKSTDKKKAAPVVAPATPNPLNEEKKAMSLEIDSLHEKLAHMTLRASESDAQAKELRAQLNIAQQSLAASNSTAHSLSMDAARQYKAMREELLTQIGGVKDQLADSQLERLSVIDNYEKKLGAQQQIIESKDRDLLAWQAKYDDMTVEFGAMLQSTLEKMSERLELTSEWSSETNRDASNPLNLNLRTVEEFAIARVK